ncbi:MAG: hypothetical protein CMO80_02045 [Verrucomicrobiales bacterium]|nr:hypothetical protein [Verrucomicrobiales bacterium]|tara:strand:- start:246 stop:725 length:480 start_codon:yes stop_codon:yes gene_type:complete
MPHLYDGPFDAITQDGKVLILKWKPETASMETKQFFESMVRLGELTIEADVHGILIDILDFRHKPTADVMAFREEHVIPIYNQTGIKRMAFLFPGESPGEATQDAGGDYEVQRFTSENEALTWAGRMPKFTEYPGVDHNCWDRAYRDPELIRWLFGQSR